MGFAEWLKTRPFPFLSVCICVHPWWPTAWLRLRACLNNLVWCPAFRLPAAKNTLKVLATAKDNKRLRFHANAAKMIFQICS